MRRGEAEGMSWASPVSADASAGTNRHTVDWNVTDFSFIGRKNFSFNGQRGGHFNGCVFFFLGPEMKFGCDCARHLSMKSTHFVIGRAKCPKFIDLTRRSINWPSKIFQMNLNFLPEFNSTVGCLKKRGKIVEKNRTTFWSIEPNNGNMADKHGGRVGIFSQSRRVDVSNTHTTKVGVDFLFFFFLVDIFVSPGK